MRDDFVAADSAKVFQALESALIHEGVHPRRQLLDHVRTDRVIEHCRRAYLHGAASEEEVVESVLEGGDASDAREGSLREPHRELSHLRQRQRKDRWSAKTAG